MLVFTTAFFNLSVHAIKKCEDPDGNENSEGNRKTNEKTSSSISENAPESEFKKIEILVVEHECRRVG